MRGMPLIKGLLQGIKDEPGMGRQAQSLNDDAAGEGIPPGALCLDENCSMTRSHQPDELLALQVFNQQVHIDLSPALGSPRLKYHAT